MTKKFSTANARAHLVALADEHGIAVSWVRSWRDAEAWPSDRCVTIPVIARARDYLVGLHEVGHCLSPQSRRLGDRFDCGGNMACEAWAWAWAVDNADPALLATTSGVEWHRVGDCMGSYLEFHALRRPGVLPPDQATLNPSAPDRPGPDQAG